MSDKANSKYRQNHFRSGIALVWTAIVLLVLILFVGLALDSAKVYLAANQLQNAADAAALAGAQIVTAGNNTNTRQRAYDLASANYYVDGSSVLLNKDRDIAIGLYFPQRTDPTRRFEPTDVNANAVKVVPKCITGQANPPVSLNFGPILRILPPFVGIDNANVDANAIAVSIGGKGAGLIVLDPHGAPGLELDGTTTTLMVNNGAIQVNSLGGVGPGKNDASVWNSAGSNITAQEIDICGALDTYKGTIPDEPPVFFGVPYMPDPLRNLVPPPSSSWGPDLSPIDPHNGKRLPLTSGHYGPGYYSAGISGSGDLTLDAGIYILDGAGLQIGGNGNFTALSVMFYITGSGSVNLTGTGNLTITEFNDSSSIYNGMAIFQDRENYNDATIKGTNAMNLTGTLYFPKNHVNLSGSSISLGIQLIAWTLKVGGGGSNTDLIINYDGRNFTPGFTSFLVE